MRPPGYDGTSPGLLVLLIRLLVIARKGLDLDRALVEPLPTLLRQRSREVERTDPDGALEANWQHPGYLSRTLGGMRIHVPFPLADMFAGGQTLTDIVGLARDVSIDGDSCLCISGSSTFLGRLLVIGDLDICEYIFRGSQLPGAIMRLTNGRGRAILCNVKCGAMNFSHPWQDCQDQLQTFVTLGAPTGNQKRRLKLDFCAVDRRLGPLPASNMILWLNPAAPEDGNGLASFAHQEAVLDRGRGIARTLVDGRRLGAYLLFLRDEMEQLVGSYPVKALKRTLSMCGLLDLEEWRVEALHWLNLPVIELATRFKRLAEFAELVQASNPLERGRLQQAVERERLDIQAQAIELDDVASVEAGVRTVVEGAIAVIDDWIGWVESTYGP